LKLIANFNPELQLGDDDVVKAPSVLSALVIPDTSLPGQLSLYFASTTGLNGPLTLAHLNFHIPKTATPGASYLVTLASVEANDDQALPLNLNGKSGLLTVVSPTTPGDLNGDGAVNVQDATLSLEITVGLLTPTDSTTAVGDVNGDGKLNVQDTTLILWMAVGIPSA
jgi:hypothetical protein